MSSAAAHKKVAIIGLGAIGGIVLEGLQSAQGSGVVADESPVTSPQSSGTDAVGGETAPVAVTAIVVRPNRASEAREAAPPGAAVVTSLDDLPADAFDLAVECAGHEAIREFGVAVLERGADLMVIATGALADDAERERLRAAAVSGGSRMLLPAGAIAGLDGLAALRRGGLTSVRYTAAKPPEAWRGTPAEEAIDLGAVEEPTAFFRGSASEAARLYPKNANLAATVALAGAGFEDTEVELIADPTTEDNIGAIEAEGRLGRLTVELRGPPMPENPKTSIVTAYSILEAIQAPHRAIVI